MSLVLGVAFGVTSTRAEVRNSDTGALVATGEARHADLGADPNDPTVWWRSLTAAVAATEERDIAAISVSGSHPGLVLVDGAGTVVRPMQPWAHADTAADASRLRKSLGPERWARISGSVPGPAAVVSRLAWLRRSDPTTFARLGTVLLPHDWLTYRLAGRAVTDRGSASLTGAWSPGAIDWSDEVIDLLAPRGQSRSWLARFPEVLGPSDRADWLTAPVYELLGLRGRPLVAPGTGEPMAVALALGIRPGRVAVSVGSTTTAIAGLERPVVDPTGEVRSRNDAAGGHLGLATSPGGHDLLETLADLFGMSVDDLAAQALDAEMPPGDLRVLPGVTGRSGAVVTGLSPGLSRAQLARAAFEGGACAALELLDLLTALDAPWDDEEPIRLAAPAEGRGARAQLLADLSGYPVLPAPGAPLAAAGACVQAAAVLDEVDPLDLADEWGLEGDEWFEPNDEPERDRRRAAHAAERKRQRRALRPD